MIGVNRPLLRALKSFFAATLSRQLAGLELTSATVPGCRHRCPGLRGLGHSVQRRGIGGRSADSEDQKAGRLQRRAALRRRQIGEPARRHSLSDQAGPERSAGG